MECVINDEVCKKLATAGYFYIYHRFADDTVEFVRNMHKAGHFASISIGVGEQARHILTTLYDTCEMPEYVTIDIAHGHAESVRDMLRWIHTSFPIIDRPYLIVGNVSSPAAVVDLEAWGADAVKVGIGPGSACTTFNATGFGSRGAQAWVVQECANARKNLNTKIIADGGVSHPGDIAKAMTIGADMVMVGGMLSGLQDSPGNCVMVEGKKYKEFWGSASANTAGKMNRIEGTKYLIPLKERTILQEFVYLTECLQSAISYGGGKDISVFKNVKWFIRR